MTTVDVDPGQYQAASSALGSTVHGQLSSAISALSSGLAGSAAMAGSDPIGMAWAAQYDRAAQAIGTAVADLDNATMSTAALLQQSGINHGTANSASNPQGGAPAPSGPTYAGGSTSAPQVPSAKGGSVDPPTGWWLVEHTVGYLWPNGDPAKLRAAGQAWSAAGSAIDGAGQGISQAVSAIQSQQSPEVADAVAVCKDLQGSFTEVAGACRDLASSCTQLANHIEQAHQQIVEELKSLLLWTAAIEAAGALGSLVSFGGAEVPAQVAEAARIAATALRIGKIIKTLGEAAAAVGRTIAAIGARIAEVAGRLAKLKDSPAIKAMIEHARMLKADVLGGLPKGVSKLSLADSQFGTKIAKHARDFGLNPANPADRQWLRDYITKIGERPTQVRQGPWNPNGGGGADYLFYLRGSDVVVAKGDGTFVSILKGGINNGWFNGAKVVK